MLITLIKAGSGVRMANLLNQTNQKQLARLTRCNLTKHAAGQIQPKRTQKLSILNTIYVRDS